MAFEEIRAKQLDMLGIKKFHDAGYLGQGITILNTEEDEDHGHKTRSIIELIAPKATILSIPISSIQSNDKAELFYYDSETDERIPYIDLVKKHKVDIISTSLSGQRRWAEPFLNLVDRMVEETGVVIFNSAGNDYSDDRNDNGIVDEGEEETIRSLWNFENCLIVGALDGSELDSMRRARYSSWGNEMEFSFPTFGLSGTSFSTPGLAAFTALLFQWYGKMLPRETKQKLIGLCTDLDIEGWDAKTGWGMPILPDPSTIEIEMQIGSKEVCKNGRISVMDVAPFIGNKEMSDLLGIDIMDRTFVPLRFVAELLGLNVEYFDDTKIISITRGGSDGG